MLAIAGCHLLRTNLAIAGCHLVGTNLPMFAIAGLTRCPCHLPPIIVVPILPFSWLVCPVMPVLPLLAVVARCCQLLLLAATTGSSYQSHHGWFELWLFPELELSTAAGAAGASGVWVWVWHSSSSQACHFWLRQARPFSLVEDA